MIKLSINYSFISSLSVPIPLLFPFMVLYRNSRTMLSGRDDSGPPCMILILKRMSSVSINIMFAVDFLVYDFHQIKKVTFCLLCVFITNRIKPYRKPFYIRTIMIFLL